MKAPATQRFNFLIRELFKKTKSKKNITEYIAIAVVTYYRQILPRLKKYDRVITNMVVCGGNLTQFIFV